MSKKLGLLIIIAVIIIGGIFFFTRQSRETPQHQVMPQDQKAGHGTLPEGVMAMDAKDFSFQPNVIHAKVGEMVRLHIQSTGQHTFTVDELGVNVRLSPVQITQVEFMPDRKGTFNFYCATPGHKEKGMLGTLRVE